MFFFRQVVIVNGLSLCNEMIRIICVIWLASIRRVLVQPQVTKTWQVNTNLTIGDRYWDTLVSVDGFTFNGTMEHAVAVPLELQVETSAYCELIFPLDEPPSLKDDAEMISEGACVDEELLTKMERIFWTDPRNWYSYSFTAATPHTERIPCVYDRVTIPNTTNTFIILPPEPIRLSSLKFGSSYLYTKKLARLSTDEYFLRHFIVKSSYTLDQMFNLSSTKCDDRTGCQCGMSGYKSEICSFVEDECPKDLQCGNPIKPLGHCCPICASTVMASFDKSRFIYKKLDVLVRKFVNNQSTELGLNVDMHTSKVSRSLVQIILVPETTYTEGVKDLAFKLAAFLAQQDNLAIDNAWAEEAGEPTTRDKLLIVAKILVGLAIVLVLGFGFVYLRNSNFFGNNLRLPFVSVNNVRYGQHDVEENPLRKSDPEDETEVVQNQNAVDTETVTQIEDGELIDTSS